MAAGLLAAGLACTLVAAGEARAQSGQTGSLSAVSGGVAALVNDDVISIYDLRQRALLFIVSAGCPPPRRTFRRSSRRPCAP